MRLWYGVNGRGRASFNSRTREGATGNLPSFVGVNARFNSRTREGATEVFMRNIGNIYSVSIHAPVRVRRQHFGSVSVDGVVSIHAPVRVRLSA